MKNLPTFAEKPELWDDHYFNDLMEEAAFANMTWEEQEKYIASMKQRWDFKNTLDFAEMTGREEGRRKSRPGDAEDGSGDSDHHSGDRSHRGAAPGAVI